MKRNHKLLNWIADRGYYIALGVCVLAVGISAILFVHSLRPARTEAPEDTEQQLVLPTLSDTWLPHRPSETKDVPAAVMDPIVKPGAKPTEPVRDEPEIADPSAPTDAPAPSDTPAAPARLQTVTPLEGAVSQPYSMDKLCYNATTKDWRTHAGWTLPRRLARWYRRPLPAGCRASMRTPCWARPLPSSTMGAL